MTMTKCQVHPKYEGKGKPVLTKDGCVCAAIWLDRQNKPRAHSKPNQVFKDESKYDRKRDKKVDDDD